MASAANNSGGLLQYIPVPLQNADFGILKGNRYKSGV